MSIKLTMQVKALETEKKEMKRDLDKLVKSVNTLKVRMSHLERHPDSKGTVRVPQVDLPETLDQLEIGRNPTGT
jgi:predicted nuclease with TOPRIM domain